MDMERRTFLRQTAVAGVVGLLPLPALAQTSRVRLIVDPADPIATSAPVRWAAERLQAALALKGVEAQIAGSLDGTATGDTPIVLASSGNELAQRVLGTAGVTIPDGPESLALISGSLDGRPVLLAAGNGPVGLMYAVTDLADRVRCAEAGQTGFAIGRPIIEAPTNRVRAVARLVASEVEDKEWLHDRDMWRAYLTLLAENRFNRFSLTFGVQYDYPMEVSDVYFYFAYPFLLSVPGYPVRAGGLSDAERDRNLDTLRFIGQETVRRGIEFRIGLWTHGYKFDSPRVNYRIEGITPENHAPYCRDALAMLLKEVPEITALTFRLHGESGIPEGSYDFWRTVFQGISTAGRQISIDMHPKGIDQSTLDLAQETGMPFSVSPKYMGEHMGLPYHESAIRDVDMPPPGGSGNSYFALSEGARKFTRYSYADYLTEDRKYGVVFRVWPGTQRVLLWGDPVLAAGFGRHAGFCGADGVEFFEPLSFRGRKGSGRPGNRNGYADAALAPAYDWQKAAYSYRLFGRLTYRPDSPPELWRRDLSVSFGPAAGDIEVALANASRILPLVTMAHGASAANNSYWPEIYTNMSIVRDEPGLPYYDTPKPPRFGTVQSFDPQVFQTIDGFAQSLLAGMPEPRTTPVEVAYWLDGFAAQAEESLVAARSKGVIGPAFERVAVDVAIQAALGRFFAHKMRAGMLWAIHTSTDDATAAAEALRSYRAARAALVQAADAAVVYVPDLTFGSEPWLRGHWRDRIPAIDADIAEMERLATDTNAGGGDARQQTQAAVAHILATPLRRDMSAQHIAPARFKRGEQISLSIATSEDTRSARLHFRHVNQAEAWQTADMRLDGGRFTAAIPPAYTDSPFALQYYFTLFQTNSSGLFPGLAIDLANQPYLVVRQG
jgi:hypothetical protein